MMVSCSANLDNADYSLFHFCQQMNKGKPQSSGKTPTDNKDNKVGQLFPNASLEDYAKLNRHGEDRDVGEICDSKSVDSDDEVCDDEDDVSENEDQDDNNEEDNEGKVLV